MALGVKHGDEVLVPNLTMIATATAVEMVGATPVFVDVDDTGCLSLDAALSKVNRFTKAAIHVSLNGRANNIYRFVQEMHRIGVPVIEDACQSLGSKEGNKSIGSFGDIGCFSFSPHKIISTGQGGCSVTSDPALYDKLRELKDFGRIKGGMDIHPAFGVNGKFSDFLAVVGLSQLRDIENRKMLKQDLFQKYYQELEGVVDFIIPVTDGWVPWFVDIYLDKPDALKAYLADRGIQTRRMYPILSSQPIYLGSELTPKAEELAGRGLWLPSSLDLTQEYILEICKHIKDFIQ
jgi:perosamine synthetase